MDIQKKSKKTKTSKPPQGRPKSTALISQLVAEDISGSFALSSFSSQGDLFAYVPLAVDKHSLRVYDTTTGQAIADHNFDTALVSSMAWGVLELEFGQDDSLYDSQPTKKRRKKKDSLETASLVSKTIEIVALGLTDGSILCFSPSHGRVLRTLSHASSASPVTALAAGEYHRRWQIWASGQDGTLRLWDVNKNEVVGSWKNDDRIPYTSIAIRPNKEKNGTEILSASHKIRLLSGLGAEGIPPQKMSQVAVFTGHSSPVQSVKWVRSETMSTSNRFVSMAKTDRFLYVWDVPDSADVDGKPVASIPLDSDARLFSLSDFTISLHPPVLLTISASGKIALYPIPHQISSLRSSIRSSPNLFTLHPRSTITPSSKKSSAPAPVINASFVRGEQGKVCVARLIQGIRPVFTIIHYLDKTGQFLEDLEMENVPDTSLNEAQTLIPNKRYNQAAVVVTSGLEPGHDKNMDEIPVRDIDGELEVDLAELSLGQRLAAVGGADIQRASDSEDGQPSSAKSRSTKKRTKAELNVVPANSLTRTLIQALHSSDAKLIETCLAHSNQDLIRNTVRRLPSQLAIPLLNTCVERLGRGARATNLKGGGAGASAQRGITLISWIRTVLAVHTGHLMTVPDFVARLSGLHTTLTARLALQGNLLSLSGKLDMVLSQIEMRSSAAPALLAPKNVKTPAAKEAPVKQYVEGESDSSDDGSTQMDVEIEIGSDEGSVEDVELGGDSEEDSAEEDEESSEDDEGRYSHDSGVDQFVDDEAEEYSEEEEDENSE